jgi:hypothetical protein
MINAMRRNFPFPLFLLTVFLAGSAQAQADSGRGDVNFYDRFNPTAFVSRVRNVYEGEIEGVGKVVVELGLSSKKAGHFSGRYFFTHVGDDIPLEGPLEAMIEPEPIEGNEKGNPQYKGFDKPRAVWNFHQKGGCCPDGEWVDRRTGKTHPFHLRDVSLRKMAEESLGFEIKDKNDLPDPYRFLQIRAVARPVGEETTHGAVAYRMWEDPRTKIAYPRLTRHPDPAVMARINFLLEEKHGRFAAEMRWAQGGECAEGGVRGGTEVTYLTTRVMSMIEWGVFHFCLSEFYPYRHPVTFDLIRGEYLDWNRLLALFVPGEDKSPQPDPAFRDWYARLEPEASEDSPQAREVSAGCPQPVERFQNAYFVDDPGALVLEGSYPLNPCTWRAVLPFSRLKPVLKPEGMRYLFPK